jgi:hypothetical protein
MKNRTATYPIRVAVPYYGTLMRPGVGLEHLYFLVDVDRESGTFQKPKLEVWNPRECRQVARWLQQSGATGLLCSDYHPAFEEMLHKDGLWVRWQQQGDLPEVIGRWSREGAARAMKGHAIENRGDHQGAGA